MKNEKAKRLLKLIKQNPTLPIVPMVSGEIAGDDCGYWVGSWGYATVDQYLLSYKGQYLFKSDDDMFDTLERYLPTGLFNALPEAESECRKIYEKLPWEKAIIVYIETNDEE